MMAQLGFMLRQFLKGAPVDEQILPQSAWNGEACELVKNAIELGQLRKYTVRDNSGTHMILLMAVAPDTPRFVGKQAG